jgi:Zn-dependent peptidase ImmA (M78 family)
MHRDRPIDGKIQNNKPRERLEIEADKFATYFLMPAKLVKSKFREIFGTIDRFTLNNDTAFALDSSDPDGLLTTCKTRRELAKTLAKAEVYNSKHVVSLSKYFGVSIEAMAIRIEEMDLV